jgi:hypothetical protein
MIAALRALDALSHLDSFLPETPPSPLAQLKLRGKQRYRARSVNINHLYTPETIQSNVNTAPTKHVTKISRYASKAKKKPIKIQEEGLDW